MKKYKPTSPAPRSGSFKSPDGMTGRNGSIRAPTRDSKHPSCFQGAGELGPKAPDRPLPAKTKKG